MQTSSALEAAVTETPPEGPVSVEEQLALAASIIARADRTVRPNALLLITWGLVSCVQNILFYVYYSRYYTLGPAHAPALMRVIALDLSLVSAAATVLVLALQRAPTRQTMVDRQLSITFLAAWGIWFMFAALSFPYWAFAGPSYPLLLNALFALAMLSLGTQYRSRVLALGGGALILSILAARADVWHIDLYLAFGQLLGIALPGLVFARRTR